jgi:proteasome lid subunit RPN8/RPN11
MGKSKQLLPKYEENDEEPIKEFMQYHIGGGDVSVSMDDIAIAMSKEVYQKILSYVMATGDEISGLGMCKKQGSVIRVYELIMPKQQNSGSNTELDEEDTSKIITDMVRAGRDMSELRCWWHSHVNMKCFWSATDETTCRKIGQGDWFISIVANKKNRMLARLDIYKPFRLTLDNIEIMVEDNIEFIIPQSIKDEIEEKVSPKSYYQTGQRWNQNTGYNYFGSDWWNKKTHGKKDGSFKKGTRTLRWNKQDRTLEVFDEKRKEWVSEADSNRRDYQAELEILTKDVPTPPLAEWDGEMVITNGMETFKPCNDGRKFGDVPPTEIFEYCKGAERDVPLCKSCAYKKECDMFFV